MIKLSCNFIMFCKKKKETIMAEKRVWLFKEGNAKMRAELGGKGANLAEMTNLSLPVPPGLTITTASCMDYINHGNKMPEGLMAEVKFALKTVEEQAGKKFGDKTNPLLVSVRSGARVSMPGMMETILNLGLNDETVEAMAKQSGKERFAYDCYRRFILMFTNIAKGHPRTEMDKMLDEIKEAKGIKNDFDVEVEDLKVLIKKY